MPIGTLVDDLKRSDIGSIYWRNFCIQFRADLLDQDIARQIFKTAATDKSYRAAIDRNAIHPGKFDLPHIARQALYSACTDNMHAISASTCCPTLGDLPNIVSTVISYQTFEGYCIKSIPVFRRMLIGMLAKSGCAMPSRGFGTRNMLAELHKRGIVCLNDLPDFTKSILPYITIKTRYARFWLAGDPAGFPSHPDEVRDLFGLGYLKKGDGLLRISMPTSVLAQMLGGNVSLIRRPVAFCVNDDDAPRFRGLTVDEHHRIPLATIDKHGITVHLERLAVGDPSNDGEQEWICPQVALNGNDIKIDLLGDVQTDRATPSNMTYKDYLSTAFSLSAADEHAIITKLSS